MRKNQNVQIVMRYGGGVRVVEKKMVKLLEDNKEDWHEDRR